MQQITAITDRPNQLMTLVLDNNETALFRIYYLARQQEWCFDLTYNDITLNCKRIVLTANILSQFRQQMPFGIAFVAQDNIEPFSIFDFVTQRVVMYVLNSDEVQQIEEEIYNL